MAIKVNKQISSIQGLLHGSDLKQVIVNIAKQLLGRSGVLWGSLAKLMMWCQTDS